MSLTIKQLFNDANDEIRKFNFKKAIVLYKLIIDIEPNNYSAYFFLGLMLRKIGNIEEAKKNYEKAIKLKPDFADAYYNLGNIFKFLKIFDEAKRNYEKAIKLKPDFADAYYNLGNISYFLKIFNEAKRNYEKAIKLKPNFTKAYFNLGNTLKDLGELDDAELNFKRVLSLQPDYPMQHSLQLILKLKKLLFHIKKNNKNTIKKNYNLQFSNNPFITNLSVNENLIKYVYETKCRELDSTLDARYGNGRCSVNFELFNDNNSIIKNVSNDLINLAQKTLSSKIYVYDSFFNILNTEGGTTPHNHISEFDKNQNLINQKYSLVYYISTGDQNSSDPGVLKLYNPNKEILPKVGMVLIIPANQNHSAIYNGHKDRIMIGMNFYCI